MSTNQTCITLQWELGYALQQRIHSINNVVGAGAEGRQTVFVTFCRCGSLVSQHIDHIPELVGGQVIKQIVNHVLEEIEPAEGGIWELWAV